MKCKFGFLWKGIGEKYYYEWINFNDNGKKIKLLSIIYVKYNLCCIFIFSQTVINCEV